MKAESVHAALLLMVVVGLGLAVFATLETYIPPLQGACSVNPFISCSKVDTSNHTSTLGIPDWSIGVAGFVVLLGLEIPLYRTWRRDLLTGVLAVSGLGIVAAVYLGYVELDVIHALCPVCFSTYVADTIVFLLSLWLFWSSRGAASGDEAGLAKPDEASESPPTAA
ncbi:MAG: vitamin K epoxide reductase family protein [Thermoplasmata archaeon]|nr:vitamin K epoxide reductase family protein [Thermoplasmata archaeon]